MHAMKVISPVMLAAALSGCTTLSNQVDKEVGAAYDKASTLSQSTAQAAIAGKGDEGPVFRNKGFWLGTQVKPLQEDERLPAIFNTHITFDRTVKGLPDFAEKLSIRLGMPVKMTTDAISIGIASKEHNGFNGASPEAASAGGTAAPASTSSSSTRSGLGADGSKNSGPIEDVRIQYPGGTLKGLLDVVAQKFMVSWRYENGRIVFYFVDTKSFNIHAVPGNATLTASVAGDGVKSSDSSSNSSSSNGNKLAVDSQLSVWSNIEKAVASMVSPVGKVIPSPATGMLTVTDVPEVLDRIGRYIDAENRSLMRQVVVNVTVLGVTLNNSEGYGINWNTVYTKAFKQFGITNAFPTDMSAGSISASILNTSSSRWAGSDIMINALSGEGKVRRDTALSVVALNNQPVPVLVAQQTAYLASSQTTLSQTGTTTSLTPGQITSGVNMSFLPKVLDNGKIILQMSASLSVLRGIQQVSSNGSTIQTPQIDTRNFLQRVAMKSGETLVISGFEQNDGDVTRQGVGDAHNLAMGGVNTKNSKEVFVIIVTPTVLGSEAL